MRENLQAGSPFCKERGDGDVTTAVRSPPLDPSTLSVHILATAMAPPPKTQYTKSGDLHIAYQVTGTGSLDLVFVPGFVSHLECQWEHPWSARFFERLGSFSRLIRFDKRGTGLSDRVGGIPTLEQRMDDVRAVMDAVGVERAALFGGREAALPVDERAALFGTPPPAQEPEADHRLAMFGATPAWSIPGEEAEPLAPQPWEEPAAPPPPR